MRFGVIKSWTVAACLKNAGQVTCEYDMRVATNHSFVHIIPTMGVIKTQGYFTKTGVAWVSVSSHQSIPFTDSPVRSLVRRLCIRGVV